MRHENSYKEHMKNSAVQKQRKTYRFMMDVYSQMVIDEAIFKAKKQKLLAEIDCALDNNDRDTFNQLSSDYKQLLDKNCPINI